ncbi:lipid-binding SYLF domain-containing protein [Tateyamaria pelophila]|uniref:hypothetical protein n=1 Tax=Tateyamaria pelophila TaxID=328415 RepID=UPI001CC13B95|nr:hypothetical protein [Tateyamaria pelophila]
MTVKIILIAGLLAIAQGAAAENLFGRIKEGASDLATGTSNVVKGVAKSVDESIDSTEELLSNEETPELTRQRLDDHTAETLARLFDEEPDAFGLFERSVGYAVFDTRRLGVIGITGGFGRGVAVSRETGERTYMQMGTGGVNLSFGIGGFDRQIVILFEDPYKFHMFSTGGYDATADAGAMMGDDKVEETVRFIDGRSIFVLTKKGWKVSATATGTKYWVDDKLNF